MIVKFFLAIYIGLFMFTPPFRGMSFGTDKLCWFVSLVVLFWNRRTALQMARNLNLSRFFVLGVALGMVHLFVLLINGKLNTYSLMTGSWTLTYLDASKFLVIIPFLWSFFILGERLRLKYADLFDVFLIVLLIWGCSSVFLILMPSFNFYLMTSILRFDDVDSKVIRISNRGFGFSQGHLFEYGIVLSYLLALISWNSLYRKTYLFWLVLLAPVLTLTYAFNARIAFVTSAAALSIVVFDAKTWHVRIALAVVTVIGAYLGFTLLGYLFPNVRDVTEWVANAFRDLFGGVNYYETSTIDTLMAKWHVPSGSGLVVGHGVYLPLSNTFARSDTGYVIQLYYGGLLYLSALLATYFFVVPWQALWRRRMYAEVFVISAIFGTMLIANLKGGVFSSVSVAKVYFLAVMTLYLHPMFRQQRQP